MKKFGEWRDCADACRTTVGKEAGNGEPSSSWKKRILLAEHSPIRVMRFNHVIREVKSWVATHLTRHSVGFTPFVTTQRGDRTGIPRDALPQGALVDIRIDANAQAIINTSRKRLCTQASLETRQAWRKFLDELEEPELLSVCVPECIYRGFCPEFEPCGYVNTNEYRRDLLAYREVV